MKTDVLVSFLFNILFMKIAVFSMNNYAGYYLYSVVFGTCVPFDKFFVRCLTDVMY